MKKIIVIAAALLLSACGFHLKGSQGLSGNLPYQHWSVSGGALQAALETALRRADGMPVAANQAQADIAVTHVDNRREVYTITRAADINEYLLTLHVRAQASRHGKPLGEPFEVYAHRTMNYTDSEVLGKEEEGQTIWSEMYADAAEQIVRRLTFMKAAD
ncbi:LPS assembly lipoprotein LptE [Neisseria lisongii]|uniref:LPS-assembly lipoprotein LptE n=1 Tax=Neisseria lisongii TaxID=2912188 RepID=A0AAW5APW2_9NEIS|nr:LPS assembly lipoprotein LptE [Neisseria lisongii]MCF7529418.1 LPS assembly lipoprotein LptE [Neisseria lisongii]